MAVDIPIWDNNPGPISGSTPFGFYDDDSVFQSLGPKFADYAARKLGYPILDVELQSGSFYAAFEEAITEYSNQINQFNIRENLFSIKGAPTSTDLTQKVVNDGLGMIITLSEQYGTEAGVGGNVTWKTGSIAISQSVQDYNLDELFAQSKESGSHIEIKRIHHYQPSAIERYYDPYVDTGLGTRNMLSEFGWGNYSPGVRFVLMPVYADLLRLQAIEFNDMVRKSQYSFRLINNRLKIFPIPTTNTTLHFEYIVKEDRDDPLRGISSTDDVVSDSSNAPYDNIQPSKINSVGRRWIFPYGVELVKEILGWIRSKYSSIPIPDNEMTLNGDALISSAEESKRSLVEELRENLAETSRTKQMENKSQEAEYMQEILNKVPLKIYVG